MLDPPGTLQGINVNGGPVLYKGNTTHGVPTVVTLLELLVHYPVTRQVADAAMFIAINGRDFHGRDGRNGRQLGTEPFLRGWQKFHACACRIGCHVVGPSQFQMNRGMRHRIFVEAGWPWALRMLRDMALAETRVDAVAMNVPLNKCVRAQCWETTLGMAPYFKSGTGTFLLKAGISVWFGFLLMRYLFGCRAVARARLTRSRPQACLRQQLRMPHSSWAMWLGRKHP